LVLLPPWEYKEVPPDEIRTLSKKIDVTDDGRLIGKRDPISLWGTSFIIHSFIINESPFMVI